jgi:hypothetical protein
MHPPQQQRHHKMKTTAMIQIQTLSSMGVTTAVEGLGEGIAKREHAREGS